jgi:glycerophosphoryl diester phosphodiesterase
MSEPAPLSVVKQFADNTEAQRPSAAIIGHRGAAHDAPENTLASVKLAWEQGADAVEVDLLSTVDGRIVCYHDKDTKRIGGRDKPVAQQTLAELQTLDAGSWKGPRWKGEKIPTLDDVLASIPEGKRLFLEIKGGSEMLPELKRVFAAAAAEPRQTVLIGFSRELMQAVKQAFPTRETCWVVELVQDKRTGRWNPPVEELVERAKEYELDGLDLGICPGIDAEFVSKVKNAGLRFYAWTVNLVGDARRLDAYGADGITTDRPGWLREQLARQPPRQ